MNSHPNSKFSAFLGVLLMVTILFYYAGRDLGLEGIGFTILFPILFVLAFTIDKAAGIYRYQETILFILFIVLALTSVFYSDIDMVYFNFAFYKTLAAFLAAYIGIALCTTLKLEDYFHIGFILSLLLIIYAEYSAGNFDLASYYAPKATRHDFGYNANYYSYIALFANFSNFRLHLRYKNIWTFLGLLLIPILGVAISFTTQSRGGLIFILLINALFWFWVYKPEIRNPIYSIIRKVLLLTFAIAFLFQFISVYTNSNIENRMASSSVSKDARGHLAEKGIEVFLDNPFLGVGAGNFASYNSSGTISHNNYVDALAEHGLFIGSIIILVFIIPVFKSYKLYSRNTSNPEYKLSLLFFAVFLLFNNIYVFYKASFSMMYFFVMLGIHYNFFKTDKSN